MQDFYPSRQDEEKIIPRVDKTVYSKKKVGEYSLNNIELDEYEKNGFGRWAVIKKASESFIGWCGLKLNEQNLIDIGFRFFRREWNKGYATEAAKACLEYGFKELNLKEIIGRVAQENNGSIKVLEKLSMEYWKNDSCKGIENSLYYKISKEQYLKNVKTSI